ncbi:MAG TPA: IPT/TIG domain-containing protein [Bryobacteraceae bacterium]|nr:IPT/TIG domain-containing protein [Bryobacteraceae bacterium]
MTFTRAAVLLTLMAPFLSAQQWPRKEDANKERNREEWFYGQRVYPRSSIPAGARLDAIRRIREIDAATRLQHQALHDASPEGRSLPAVTMDSVNWSLIGPKPTDGNTTSSTAGRVTAIAIDPRDNNVVYIGTAEGGVWKTTDGGGNWTPLTDDQPSLATGAIVIDPSSPDTVYVGTGEENFAQDSYYGAGILKSTDGGATWTNIVGPFLRDRIGALAIRPGNSQILLCTSQNGVWRSANAGATWSNVLTGAAGISVVFDPTNGASAYASLGTVGGNSKNGIYHSTDGGLTWSLAMGSGPGAVPTTNVGRIDLAMAPSSPATIYAQIGNSSTNGLLGIYKTLDGGANWSKLPIANPALWGTQQYFTNSIRVHPSNPNIVWSGALQVYRTLDGGTTWTALPQSGSNNVLIHVDCHVFAFTPDGTRLYIGNDGGIYSTSDISAGTVNWAALNSTLAITQFYPGMSIDPSNPQVTVGGTQDNGTQVYDGTLSWQQVACGDGGFTAVDPAFPGLAYAACQNVSFLRSLNLTGSTSSWITASYGLDSTDLSQFISPVAMDGANPQTLYFGTYRLWQTQDSGGRWYPISPDLTGGKKGSLKAVAVAPSDSNTIYIGTSNSMVQMTGNAGNGAAATWTNRSAGLPPRAVTHLAVDPLDSATAYVTFSGFNGGTDVLGHVFKTGNFGATWTDISGNLPNIPVNDLVIDPDIPQTLYIATDAGVLVTTNGGAVWSSLGIGLPKVVVNSLVLQRSSRVLRAATHGRSVWDILVPLASASLQPKISTISPTSANAGGADFTLAVSGSGFGSRTVVRWNGQARATTFVDSAHLTAKIPAADTALVGRASVSAFTAATGGGTSNSAGFLIGPGPKTSSAAFVSAANPLSGNALAPRSIATLYGTNLAAQTAVADLAPPLPFTLGGTTLTLLSGTQTVPVFFVSPNQINFQVPLLALGTQTLTVTQGVQSVSIPVQLVAYSPAIFTTNSQGSGQGSVTIANTASVAAPVGVFSEARPAKIGEYVSIYCTGLGDVSNRPALGSPSPSNPLAATLVQPTVTIGGVPASVSFSGLAPGYVGLYQINAQVPATASVGSAIPLVVTIGGTTSNTVTIAVDRAQ